MPLISRKFFEGRMRRERDIKIALYNKQQGGPATARLCPYACAHFAGRDKHGDEREWTAHAFIGLDQIRGSI